MYYDINRPLCLAEDTLSFWAFQPTNDKIMWACQLPESLRGSKDSYWKQYLLLSAIPLSGACLSVPFMACHKEIVVLGILPNSLPASSLPSWQQNQSNSSGCCQEHPIFDQLEMCGYCSRANFLPSKVRPWLRVGWQQRLCPPFIWIRRSPKTEGP